MLIVSSFKTPVGWLEVSYNEHYLFQASFTETPTQNNQSNSLTTLISQEIEQYFADPHYRFRLSLKPQGTSYQQRVWNALLVIPVGRSLSYGELASRLQSSPRAIGQACKSNPIALFIPCHRVVGKHNQGGYMGKPEALCYKIGLLKHEGLLSI
ncbi:methylated-DNA--[protein]-cysteine S-methyltransferase [Legionella jordanis]|uniref:Methylated DNA protein cysteine S-methyltransferase n=1 Tax=Legionella jordanis TaxID=456 RepID=A0A0W0VET4_9GAMM|nr:methylated-DNA--[protein]-cysteine S-methyltransferase [Legionella jordanis]KTD18652.1 methylated DNA protein cysteine S- methyltransferase [Legionella jordanis]RMX00839.1 methylated-DNA--[protein]-cysteine S-methyltransferase [Legionella jordanis]RMX17953.1 methylated-DNA--[protein]-cysteine S-methyltransferase [Legionella jordanis]VEH11528.1 Methylated DNA-protein cysteine methyltransferase [Legionella jordanis]HAT8715127.1 methylated-DNA--[protein]-cysteine S-methyltransferase [Legionell